MADDHLDAWRLLGAWLATTTADGRGLYKSRAFAGPP
jgi:hypothetical protein